MKRRLFLLPLLVVACCSVGMALGRRPQNEDNDSFPDYNRIEMHPKPNAPQTPQPTTTTPAAPGQVDTVDQYGQPLRPKGVGAPPALNTPLNPVDDTTPLPPPKVVPLPDDSSEPPLPDEIKNNLVPSTTGQN